MYVTVISDVHALKRGGLYGSKLTHVVLEIPSAHISRGTVYARIYCLVWRD
jgi:hypothetical protein